MNRSVRTTINNPNASRPWVLIKDATYQMWYSYTEKDQDYRYQIGYAASRNASDGWLINNETEGLLPSADGWDSEMVAYPAVFEHRDNRYMLYNGNDFGREGFGLAIWEDQGKEEK